ncbi:hypothetical protein BC833DRAFT_596190 [Globomyces pollinis-pini]|nr:hypothetical protein BC833DRAFT_596190 [Globomyces pollinis-pini]
MQSHHSSFSSNRKEHNSLWDLAASEIVTKVTKKDNNNLMADENLAIQRNFKAGVKSTIPAVLSVKIKKLSIDKEKLSQQGIYYESVYCNVINRNFLSKTTVKRIPKGSATFNQVKHFAVNIVDNRSHPHNLVRIDIVGVGRENKEYDIGAILFHLHDIIKGSPSSGEYGINGQHTIVGFVSMEITSNYGSFGYGYSNQLSEEDYTNDELIQYSLLPRINPPNEDCEYGEIVVRSQAIAHPSFIPFEKQVFLSHGKDLQSQLQEISETLYKPKSFSESTNRIKSFLEKYYEINDRASRLTALHNHLQQNQQRSENVPVKPDDIQDVEYPSTSYIKYLQPLSAIQEPVYEHSTYRNTMAGKLTLTPQFKIIHSVEDPSPLD